MNKFKKTNSVDFSGRGPKGYRRSDERIKEEVCELLSYSHELDATNLEVFVSEGIVTLNGIVESRAEKRLAEDLIEDVPGIVDVHNHLTIDKNVEGWVPVRSQDPDNISEGI